ncbi:MAG: ATP-grasp domain-containing protein [Chloroflexi bacterium]|nr:ATP-grasp domain-containing protein [Chloroflexota bacterium]
MAYHQRDFRHVEVVDDYESPRVDALIDDLALRFRARRILSSAEADVIRAARSRERLDLPGQRLDSAQAFRDKFDMKQRVASQGLSVPPMRKLRRSADLLAFSERHGFPVVVKPRAGGGSVGVSVLSSPSEMHTFLNRWTAQQATGVQTPFLVEAWVDGGFYTLDGLMMGGRILQVWPSRTTANFEAVSGNSLLNSWMLSPDDPLKSTISCFVSQVIATLPAIDEITAFHAEVFEQPDGKLTLCEIACRPGGCGHVPVYEHAFGINLYAETLRGQAGLPRDLRSLEEIQSRSGGFIWFPPKPGKLKFIPTVCPLPGVLRYSASATVGAYYGAPRSVADNIAQAFLTGAPDSDIAPIVQNVGNWWTHRCLWE